MTAFAILAMFFLNTTFVSRKHSRNENTYWRKVIQMQGAVHILRQPPEGGEGVWQMLTIADEGGRGGKPKADHC